MPRRNNIAAAVALAALALTLAGCGRVVRDESKVFIDPQFAALVPPDTTLLVGTRIEHLIKTPLYQKYLSGGRIHIVDRIARGTGINPEKSLWNLMYVSNGKKSFVLGRGKFADELMAPDFSKPGVRRFSYKNLTLFGDDQQAMMLVNSSTMAIGETDLLRSLVDQRPSLMGIPERLTALIQEIPYQTQFWGAYAGGPVDVPFTGNLENVNKILGMVRRGIFYFDLANGVGGTVHGDAANAEDARQLHDALTGFIGLGRMLAPKKQPELQRVFDGLQVTQEGRRVIVKIAEPEELAGKFLDGWLSQ